VRERLLELLDGFEPVSLQALDERAALLRRVDAKYAVPWEAFLELADRLRGSHQVLEIDGRRSFAYSTTYFDTPELLCFVEHVEQHLPRFKVRSRLYEDNHQCGRPPRLRASDLRPRCRADRAARCKRGDASRLGPDRDEVRAWRESPRAARRPP
jgi:VTC domain